jgi:alpha/beta superfamily hydrolase
MEILDYDVWFEHDAKSIGEAILESCKAYERCIYVGKSLGTSMLLIQALSNLLAQKAKLVWLTPGGKAKEIFDYLASCEQASLVVYGDADTLSKNVDRTAVYKNAHVSVKTIHGASHCFESDKDVFESIDNLKQVIRYVADFVQ